MREDRVTVRLQGTADPGLELIFVGGPHPYLWIGGKEGLFATLDIPPAFAKRTSDLLFDLSEAAHA